MDIKINLLTEKWAERKFTGGPLDGQMKAEPESKTKVTHYVYGVQEVNGHKVDVLEYVYRLNDGVFVNVEINGIIRHYE